VCRRNESGNLLELPDFSKTEVFHGHIIPDIMRPTTAEGPSGYLKNNVLRVSEEGTVAFTLSYASGIFHCQSGDFSKAFLKLLKSFGFPNMILCVVPQVVL
jgi:hypothetical protein